jgi:hypothetical protein
MAQQRDTLSPERWMAMLFDAREARRGGVIRRRVRDVEQSDGREAFLREVERRGYQVVENGRQFVVFCNRAAIQRVWSSAFLAAH